MYARVALGWDPRNKKYVRLSKHPGGDEPASRDHEITVPSFGGMKLEARIYAVIYIGNECSGFFSREIVHNDLGW